MIKDLPASAAVSIRFSSGSHRKVRTVPVPACRLRWATSWPRWRSNADSCLPMSPVAPAIRIDSGFNAPPLFTQHSVNKGFGKKGSEIVTKLKIEAHPWLDPAEDLVCGPERPEHKFPFRAKQVSHVQTKLEFFTLSEVFGSVEIQTVEGNRKDIRLVGDTHVGECLSLDVVEKSRLQAVVHPFVGESGVDDIGRLTGHFSCRFYRFVLPGIEYPRIVFGRRHFNPGAGHRHIAVQGKVLERGGNKRKILPHFQFDTVGRTVAYVAWLKVVGCLYILHDLDRAIKLLIEKTGRDSLSKLLKDLPSRIEVVDARSRQVTIPYYFSGRAYIRKERSNEGTSREGVQNFSIR